MSIHASAALNLERPHHTEDCCIRVFRSKTRTWVLLPHPDAIVRFVCGPCDVEYVADVVDLVCTVQGTCTGVGWMYEIGSRGLRICEDEDTAINDNSNYQGLQT